LAAELDGAAPGAGEAPGAAVEAEAGDVGHDGKGSGEGRRPVERPGGVPARYYMKAINSYYVPRDAPIVDNAGGAGAPAGGGSSGGGSCPLARACAYCVASATAACRASGRVRAATAVRATGKHEAPTVPAARVTTQPATPPGWRRATATTTEPDWTAGTPWDWSCEREAGRLVDMARREDGEATSRRRQNARALEAPRRAAAGGGKGRAAPRAGRRRP